MSEIVQLNVSGECFSTRLSTLTRVRGSMLEAMFSGRHELARDTDGRVFIDRPSAPFRRILSALQTCVDLSRGLPVPDGLAQFDKDELLREMDYYGLPVDCALPVERARPPTTHCVVNVGSSPSAFAPPDVLSRLTAYGASIVGAHTRSSAHGEFRPQPFEFLNRTPENVLMDWFSLEGYKLAQVMSPSSGRTKYVFEKST
eukprot:gnl/Spiro4/23100_TR11423_c0_g1_i1.p2 gnl/Spiro4/23100_TR11423_c0_g1~~gnl/Spiro4/23100_TR11423_c0_g1_i1.p2  ORF type:complete len:215 (+),score=70.60 gnl/Spiro4/23100_TR11423_c0_g1_i1:44-646(+)